MNSAVQKNIEIWDSVSPEFSLESHEVAGIPGKSPIFRWAGSKKKLLSALQIAAPDEFGKYYEPFFGSGILFLHLKPKGSVISDINPHLMQAYEVIRDNPELLWRAVKNIPSDDEVYYQIRGINHNDLDPISRAARFVYLNRFCFNGVYRTNQQGGFNVSRGKGNLGIPCKEVFLSFSERLKGSEIYNVDFEKIINKAKKNDFVYLDPPYIDLTKRDRGEYGLGSFRFSDLERLVSCVNRASDRGVKILISYFDCPHLMSMLPKWYIERLTVRRNISSNTSARNKANEVFLSNYIL
jgi:DNA adenine methylase